MQKKGIRFRSLLEGGNMMTSIETFGDFFEVTFNTILNTTRKAYYKVGAVIGMMHIDMDITSVDELCLLHAWLAIVWSNSAS